MKTWDIHPTATALKTAALRLKRMKPIKYESSMRITSPGWHWPKLLPLLAERMADEGIVICEHETGLEMPETVGVLEQKKQKKYGAITVTTYVCRKDAV